MAIPDNYLDDLVALALESQTTTTPRRQQTMWAHVRACATDQTILVPYAISPRPSVPAAPWCDRLAPGIMKALAVLLTEESRYQRAAENRRLNEAMNWFGADRAFHFYAISPMFYQA